jgi:hypothetical protein
MSASTSSGPSRFEAPEKVDMVRWAVGRTLIMQRPWPVRPRSAARSRSAPDGADVVREGGAELVVATLPM